MSGPRSIPAEARAKQIRASDPASSSFVSANAGSGKTHVLVQRVIRLMLGGVSPEKILCITFTKAAAANMAERVFTTLGRWVTFSDAELDAALIDAGLERPTPKLRMRAREMFACALETPGGLKVQTIHALCTRLLQQFPFEAQVPARFSVMDDRDQAEMMERANMRVLLDAAAAPDSSAGRALVTAMTSAADVTFKEVVHQASLSRDHFLKWTAQAGSPEAATAQLSEALGIDPSVTLGDIESEIVDGPYLPRLEWAAVADILDTGLETDRKNAIKLRDALSGVVSAIDAYVSVFFTDKGEPRKNLVTKKLRENHPDLAQRMADEVGRLLNCLDRRRAVEMRDRTQALLIIATAVADNYSKEKLSRGILDYDDLIDKTLQMLDRIASSWVHFKLDRGIDHVLIDEAQDTSPKQWDIVAHLITEFTAGKGARDGVKRTIFAVGDEKQSIFSFQGAAPREFDARRRELHTKFTKAGLSFDPVSFTYSFRSGEAILASVDSVFENAEIFRSIHADTAKPVHQSLSDAGPSLIDLWPLEEADARDEVEGWRAAFDAKPSTSPEVKLAQRVTGEIRALVASGTQTGPAGRRRALRFGDVLVLVRRRGAAFDAIIQALKHADVPVAGADRLKLTEHIAVIDLMNLADALLLPQDDLALAIALKSPLFGLDDDDLFKIAWERKGSLRSSLAAHAGQDAKLAGALRRLVACEDRAQRETPFSFFAWLLGGDQGRARILKRLGHEANDALDEFLELALGYERRAAASLQGFVAWLRAADTDIKRDMEVRRDEVRVMTVHGAKGLEAPVVFLADTTSTPTDTARLNLIRVPQRGAANDANVVVWAGAKANDPQVVVAARDAMLAETEDEYRRLLYVAMTRAADRLIVGGCMPGNRKEVKENSWYDLIARGLEKSALDMTEFETPNGKVKRYAKGALSDLAGPVEQTAAKAPVQYPTWLRTMAPPSVPPRSAIRPSDADEVWRKFRTQDNAAARAEAKLRGTLTHRLLQSLPDLPGATRAQAAKDFLARNAKDWSEDIRNDLAARTLALIADPRFASVFADGSRAEVPIAGRLAVRDGPILVSGQVDRLVVTPADVTIVDFKTGPAHPVPPAGYIRQLALYRAVLGKLYSGRTIRAALLWTETPEIVELSGEALDAALQAFISP